MIKEQWDRLDEKIILEIIQDGELIHKEEFDCIYEAKRKARTFYIKAEGKDNE